jgi:hypothetical protein
MRAGRARTIGAACAALVAGALCLAATSAPALAAHPLEPDLVTIPMTQDDLVLDQNGRGVKRQSILRMTNEVGNQGVGPFEIRASGASANCDGDGDPDNDRIASQRIYRDEGDDGFDRDTDTDFSDSEIGCLKYHPAHLHWHVLDFSKYTLYSEETGEPTDGTKVGFCLGDSNEPFGPAPSDRFYRFSGCGTSGTPPGPPVPPSFMGISVGWADIYGSSTPGQRIRVTGLPRGRYCLRSEADPVDNLTELDDWNNATDLRIHLNLADAKVKALPSACRL